LPLPSDTPAELTPKFTTLLASTLLNAALAATKLGGSANTGNTIRWTSRVLKIDGVSDAEKAKSLYRRSLAYLSSQDLDEAEADLLAARALVPGDANITKELEKVKGLRKEQREKQRKAAKALFS
jgi:peptidyl-prolyl isomerase D